MLKNENQNENNLSSQSLKRTLYVFTRTGNTDSLPFGMILMTFVVCAQWWFFGVLLGDVFMTWPNVMGCLLAGLQLALFVYFPAKSDVSVA